MENSMGDAERPRAWRQLWDEDRLLLGRIVFWSVVFWVWTVLHIRSRLKKARAQYGT